MQTYRVATLGNEVVGIAAMDCRASEVETVSDMRRKSAKNREWQMSAKKPKRISAAAEREILKRIKQGPVNVLLLCSIRATSLALDRLIASGAIVKGPEKPFPWVHYRIAKPTKKK